MNTPTLHSAAGTPVVPTAARRGKRSVRRPGVAYYAHTQTGLRGGINQDAVLVRPPRFFGVADGVGGGAHGEVASQKALEYCAALPEVNADAVIERVKKSDAVVAEAMARLSERPGATTLAAVWLDRRQAYVVHVGDARVYHLWPDWRGRYRLERLTMDQTYGNLGEEPPDAGHPDDPCRMLGTGLAGEPPLREIRLKSNDVLLLCSDGLHRFVADHAIERIVNRGLRDRQPLQAICRRLARQSVDNNGMDDIGIVVLQKLSPFRDRLLAFVSGLVLGSAGALLYVHWPSIVAGTKQLFKITTGYW